MQLFKSNKEQVNHIQKIKHHRLSLTCYALNNNVNELALRKVICNSLTLLDIDV